MFSSISHASRKVFVFARLFFSRATRFDSGAYHSPASLPCIRPPPRLSAPGFSSGRSLPGLRNGQAHTRAIHQPAVVSSFDAAYIFSLCVPASLQASLSWAPVSWRAVILMPTTWQQDIFCCGGLHMLEWLDTCLRTRCNQCTSCMITVA